MNYQIDEIKNLRTELYNKSEKHWREHSIGSWEDIGNTVDEWIEENNLDNIEGYAKIITIVTLTEHVNIYNDPVNLQNFNGKNVLQYQARESAKNLLHYFLSHGIKDRESMEKT